MSDTIDLDAMFLTPKTALNEAKRCDDLAGHFAKLASDPVNTSPITAANLAVHYRERATRLRQIATGTAPRVQSA
jgi:hypothetical protein